MCVCLCVWLSLRVCACTCCSQITVDVQFCLPSWFSEVELRSSDLTAGIFTCWILALAFYFKLFYYILYYEILTYLFLWMNRNIYTQTYTYICMQCPKEAWGNYWMPWNWSHRWLWTVMWVLRSSAGTASVLNHRTISLAHYFTLKNWCVCVSICMFVWCDSDGRHKCVQNTWSPRATFWREFPLSPVDSTVILRIGLTGQLLLPTESSCWSINGF